MYLKKGWFHSVSWLLHVELMAGGEEHPGLETGSWAHECGLSTKENWTILF